MKLPNCDVLSKRFVEERGIRDAHSVPALDDRLDYVDVTALTERVADDFDIARNWKPGTRKDDGKRSGTEKCFRQ